MSPSEGAVNREVAGDVKLTVKAVREAPVASFARPAEPACLLVLLLLCTVAAGANGPDSPIWQAYDRAQRFGSSQLDGLVRNARVEANWSDDGNHFWYRRETADGAEFIRVDALTGMREPAFDHAALAAALTAASGQTYLPERLPFRRVEQPPAPSPNRLASSARPAPPRSRRPKSPRARAAAADWPRPTAHGPWCITSATSACATPTATRRR